MTPAAAAYDQLASIYDAAIPDPPGFTDYYLGICSAAPLDVLYVGCGTGRLLTAIARTGNPCVGVDPSAAMLDQARTHLRTAGLEQRVRLVEGTAEELSLGREFDLVLMAGGAFEYLMDTRQQLTALLRLKEHLRPGGAIHLDIAAPPHMSAHPRGNFTGEFDPRLGSRPGASVTNSSVELRFDHFRQLVHSRCTFSLADRPDPLEVSYLTRYTTASELRLLARVAGLRAQVHGDFKGGPIRRESSNYAAQLRRAGA